jgi:glycosyltransferase involved in cell wall biosynthesis
LTSHDFDVTAIAAAYQSEATIEAALASVSGQTAPASSVVVVDDGSTDGTASRASAVSGIQVTQLAHSGVVARSRNVAVEQATTEYVAFLDADDQWAPNHLEWSQEMLAPHMAGLACGNALRRLGSGTDARPFFAHLKPTSPYLSSPTPHPVPLRDLIRTRPIVTSSVVVRRSLLLAAGGFPEDLEVAGSEDFEAWCRILRLGDALYDPRVHVIYNQGPESLTRGSQEDRGRRATITALRSLLADPCFDEFHRDIRRAIARDHVTWARRCLQRGVPVDAARHLFLGGQAMVGR